MAKLGFLVMLSLVLFSSSCSLFVPAEREFTGNFTYYDESASKVQLVGDWNNWGGLTGETRYLDPSCGIMEKEDGKWSIAIPENLRRGRYRYAFLVNGVRFQHDPLNPVRDIFQQNEVSVLIVD